MTNFGSHAGTYAMVGWTIDDVSRAIDGMELPKRTDDELAQFLERNAGALEEAMNAAGEAALERLVHYWFQDFFNSKEMP